MGPIPWTAVNDWAQSRCLSANESDELEYLIRVMDTKYLEWQDRQNKAKKRA